jgi:xylulokinase
VEPLVLGIDLGTTSCKAALVGLDGRVRRLARRPTPAVIDGDRVEHDAEALVAAALGAVADVVAGDGDAVVAAGVASAAEIGVPLDRAGEALLPMIGWADRRAAGTAARLGGVLDARRLWDTTGLRMDPKYPLVKWAWLAEHAGGVLPAMGVWAGAAELVAATLTGTRPASATVASLACRTMAWDIRRGAWDEDLLFLAGVGPEQVPPVVPAGQPVGAVAPGPAALCRLRPGTPVIVAGHDHLVGALAAGADHAGALVDSAGTAEAVAVVVDRLPAAADALALGITGGCHADGRHAYLVAGWPGAGHLVPWLADRLLPDAPDAAAAVAGLVGLVGPTLPDRPAPLIVEPYVRGRAAPAPDARRTVAVHGAPTDPVPVGAAPAAAEGLGGFAGKRLGEGGAGGVAPAVLAQAALEGGAFHVRWMADAVVGLSGSVPDEVIAFGGGVQGPQWAELRAAVLLWPLRRCVEAEAVVVGAAMLAAPAAGQRIAPLASEPVIVHPDVAAAYRRRYVEAFLPAAIAPQTPGREPPPPAEPAPARPSSVPRPRTP